MSRAQKEALDAAMRSRGKIDPTVTSVAEQRSILEEVIARRPVDPEVRITPSTLGGRPALTVEVGSTPPGGVLLWLHGGGYVLGSVQTGLRFAAPFALRSHVRAEVLDYRLAPEHPYPAAVDDAVAAYRDLLDRGEPAERIVVGGESAGGGLVVAMLLAARRAGLPQPAGAVALSPFADLALAGVGFDERVAVDPLFDRRLVHSYAEHYLAGADPRAELASPIYADLSGLAPLFVQVGANEVLLDDSLRLAARAATADVDVTLQVVAGAPHGFLLSAAMVDEAEEAFVDAARFVARRLTAQAVPAT